MKRPRLFFLGAAIGLTLLTQSAQAYSNWGPLLANNIVGGAASGALVGFSAGTLAYGLNNNYTSEYLLSGTVYGLLAGALVGGGAGVYEIGANASDADFTVLEYTVGGTGIGAALGLMAATLPYMRDRDPEDFTIGLGLGGVIGAAFGLVTAAVDIQSRTAAGDRMLSGQFGIIEVASVLPAVVPGLPPERIPNCKLVKLTF